MTPEEKRAARAKLVQELTGKTPGTQPVAPEEPAKTRLQQRQELVQRLKSEQVAAPADIPYEQAPKEGQPFFEWYLGDDYKPLKTAPAGGTVYKNAKTGELAYWSPTFETFDKKAVEKLALGAQEDFVQKELRRGEIGRAQFRQAPFRTAASQMAAGGLGFGEFIDELYGVIAPSFRGEEQVAQDIETMRAGRQAFEEEMPVTAAGYQMAGALMTAPAALGRAMVGRGLGPLQRTVSGALRGGAFGAGEQAVSEFGAAEGGLEERAQAAQGGAIFGGVTGAGLGAAAEPAAVIAQNVRQMFGKYNDKAIAKGLGLPEDAAKEIADAMRRNDFAEARDILSKAGETAMLADAGMVLKSMLDTAIIEGTEVSAAVSRSAVFPRIQRIQKDLSNTLNRILGKPMGIDEILEDIQKAGRKERQDLYEQAYATVIDESTPEGADILNRINAQISQSDLDSVNETLRIAAKDPFNIPQLRRLKDEDGNVTLTVTGGQGLTIRELDRLTREMQDRAIKLHKELNPLAFGVSALKSQKGKELEILSQTLRGNARKLSPEYGKAIDAARETIQEREAAMMGQAFFDQNTTARDVAEALVEATPNERAAMKMGLRSQVANLVSNTRVTLASPDPDINALREMWKKFSIPETKEKITLLLGDEADEVFQVLDKARIAFDLQGSIAVNSRTAARNAAARISGERNAPGIRDLLMEWKPAAAFQRGIQTLTGRRPEDILKRRQANWDDIATVLTSIQGKDAQDALSSIEKIVNGQKLTTTQATQLANAIRKHVGSAIVATTAVGSEQVEQIGQTLRYNPETDDFE